MDFQYVQTTLYSTDAVTTTQVPDVKTMNITTQNPSNGAEYSHEYYILQSAIALLSQSYIWIIFAFGFPGNFLSIFVTMRMSRRRLKTSLFYVGLLAVVDNIAIALKIVENRIRNDNIPMTAVSCKFLYFLGMTFAVYANWILIVMCAERFTAVRLPLRVGLIWPLKRAGMVICAILVFLCLVQVHFFFTMTSRDYQCKIHTQFDSFFHPWWFFISFSVYGVVPTISVTVLNVLIIRGLRRSTSQRLSLMSNNERSNVRAQHQPRQATGMLITLSAVFIILTIPRCIYTIMWTYWNPVDEIGKLRKDFLDYLTMSMSDSNHAVNFYLYFLSRRTFRRHILGLFRCRKRTNIAALSLRTKISEVPIAETDV